MEPNAVSDDYGELFFRAETPADSATADDASRADTVSAFTTLTEFAVAETGALPAPTASSIADGREDDASDPETEPPPNTVMVMGYSVDFPMGKQPFPAQLAVMNSVLQALKSRQHALLESPTGSGKTLALLCSSLTFQRHHATERLQAAQQQRLVAAAAYAAQVEQRRNAAAVERQQTSLEADAGAVKTEPVALPSLPLGVSMPEIRESGLKREHSDAFASESPRRLRLRVHEPPSSLPSASADELPDLTPLQLHSHATVPPAAHTITPTTSEEPAAPKTPTGTPKIFFCSRTHSQLTQAVGELKNCPPSYLRGSTAQHPFDTELRMVVLGAKSRFCVHDDATAAAAAGVTTIADACRELLSADECQFATKRRETNDLKCVAPPVWDIEDMVALSRQYGECGYFYAREAFQDAHIVFCPYVYVLDPGIRAAANISLKDAVVIFDEAHNVEDTCRSSASLELPAARLTAAVAVFTQHLEAVERPPPYHRLLAVLRGLKRWVDGVQANAAAVLRPTADDEESRVWTGADALVMLAEFLGITRDSFRDVQADLAAVEEQEKELAMMGSGRGRGQFGREDDTEAVAGGRRDRREPREQLSQLVLSLLRSLVVVIDYMLREDLRYLDDFKLVVQRTRVPLSQRSAADANEWELKMCIWCLSARVAFSDVVRAARSVVLTSGTLSPMGSFAGELGAAFPIRLEANHVVNMKKQVFAGAVMRGPGGVDLSATYAKQQETRYQDSMGQLLLHYTHVVPGGVLMFFPSYALLEKLTDRWQATGLWRQVDAVKKVFSEPRQAGKEFDALLERYKQSVANGRSCTAGARTGAVFLAVYRGKVSEGIDFSNDNARAVLAVGIPLPNFKDLQVSLKRKYQDEKSRVDRTLVNGQTWYKLQAFRALNQALGRCIRHRKDYGTILLLDSRHRDGENTQSLSKWMRPFIQEVEQSELVLSHFIDFFKRNEQELGTGAPPSVVTRSPLQLQYEEEEEEEGEGSVVAAAPTTSPRIAAPRRPVDYWTQRQRMAANPRVTSLFQHGLPVPPGASQPPSDVAAAPISDSSAWDDPNEST